MKWLELRYKSGFSEWLSNVYYDEDIPGLVALVEFGMGGSSTAGPLAAKTVDHYLRRQHGIPLASVQTLGEHLRAGVPSPWAEWQ